MSDLTNLPGTPRHQQILQTILDYYADDSRILAVVLFGSLGRGDWDEYSDLDLDIIMADSTPIDARVELANLCASIKEAFGHEALIIADAEEGDVVLSSLLAFSIRYHVLANTKPAILETMRLLAGELTLDEIRSAANPTYLSAPQEMGETIDRCLRYALELHHAIQRQRLWMSLELLQRIRALLMAVYAAGHGTERPLQHFDAHAGPELQGQLAALVPSANLESVGKALSNTVSLLENHLDAFSGGNYPLTTAQRRVLQAIGSTVDKAAVDLSDGLFETA